MAELDTLKAENARLRALLQQHGISERQPGIVAHTTNGVAAHTTNGSAPCSAPAFERGNHNLDAELVARYSRQIILPSFGVEGQQRLCSGSVLVIGAGGLGCPAAMYLAAAGVGRIGIVDRDAVDKSNLHRQVLHREVDVGRHKATSAAAACRALNGDIQVVEHLDGFTQHNAVEIVSQYDVVMDASDNAPTRYLINDACVACNKPLVFGAAIGTDGQLTVYHYGTDCPCYRCMFPECPAPANCSRCVDAGVLGPVPGVIGVMQAVEAIKILSGKGTLLAQRLMLYDALSARMHTVKLRGRREDCVACGSSPGITRDNLHLYDYAVFTGQAPHDQAEQLHVLADEQRITPAQLQRLLHENDSTQAVLLLDTRPPHQFAIARLPGSVNVPYDTLDASLQRAQELLSSVTERTHTDPRCVVVCRRGNDSQLMVQKLHDLGFGEGVKDLIGGLTAWADECDSTFPKY